MNVLEKILNYIDRQKRVCLEIDNGEEFNAGALNMANSIKDFIRKRMDECKTFEFDFNRVKSFDCRCGRHYVNTCNDGWISVDERLPEVPEGLADEYCPEFNVTIKGAERATTLKYSWDGTWFDDRGDIYDVIAWQPLPKHYIPNELPTAKNT